MASDITPEGLRGARFGSSFRGLDPAVVESTLHDVAARIEELEEEKAKLQSRLAEIPGHDLGDELEAVGREVTAILDTAREAAESMRERASLDAARWRSEAMEEADSTRKTAAADAEALRRDAWVTGSELLGQAEQTAEAMRANAERDVLTVMGEAEREAHRLTSGARREAEDLVRNASMEAEKTTADATKRRDEIIDGANRQAATSQERTRALEQRRDELLEELENVRSTLTRLEGSLEERREALDLTAAEPSSVKVVHPPAEAKKNWELGETVRVVPPDSESKSPPEESLADEVSEQVARLNQPEGQPSESADDETKTTPPQANEDEGPDEDEVPVPEQPEPERPADTGESDVDALFASLRGGATTSRTVKDVSDKASDDEPAAERESVDWIGIREKRLLPITNRALRGVKKAMTEMQNVVLDGLRNDGGWRPDPSTMVSAVHAELVAAWSESFAAGHAVSEQMADSKLKRPSTPPFMADEEFAADLSEAVSEALDATGDGQRELQSAASRVFRVWRTDEAERRVRDIALRGYEAGLEESRKVQAGS